MKRNALIAVIITAAATLALSGAAFAKSGHGSGNGNGGSNGGDTPTTAPKPTIHPSEAVKDAIWRATNGGTIVNGCGCIEAGD